jgi:hypothetical protein
MSADTKNESSQTNQEASASGSKGTIDLSEVNAQLAALAENQKATMDALGTLARSQRQPDPVRERNLFEPSDMLAEVEERVERKLQMETAKSAKIVEMSREYPEINSNAKLMQEITNELKNVPESIRSTPAGYEMAILKAVSREGLTPKSKRSTVTVDDDASMGNRGGSQRRERAVKVSDETLAAAELMGLDINDKGVLERLQQNSNRNYNRYE